MCTYMSVLFQSSCWSVVAQTSAAVFILNYFRFKCHCNHNGYKYSSYKKLGLRLAHINCKCLELYARNVFYTIHWLWSNTDAD